MKKSILGMLCFVIFTFSITAQSQTTFTGLKKTYTQSSDSLLTYVNKAPITTGILYDRVMSFSDLDWLKENATITNSNYQHFIQSWSELYRSAYTPTFPTLEILKTTINANTNASLVDIGIINTKMNYIDFGTSTNPSLTKTGGYLYNIAGINPFLEKQITVIAPLKERVNSGIITFRLKSALMLQLTGLQIKTLVANFGTATNYNLISNYVVSTTNPIVSYTTSGKKTFVFTVTFSNNTTETLNATMDIVVSNSSAMALAIANPLSFPSEENFVGTAGITASTVGNVAFQGYNETTATKGVIEYRTYYNTVTNPGYSATTSSFTAQPKINKPIIILDGYDPGDVRKTYQGSVGYDAEKSSLYQLMYYDDDNNPATIKISLVEKLRSAPYGFDVTLVNFPKGADYVERNAMALVALLKRENAKLTANSSIEKVSIIGPSMGGLVSRYALAYMEKNNIIHNTKLWVSFDSPPLGANIPIGAQENLYFYGYLGQQDKAKIKFDENFRSPAARQMLIEQLDGKQENAPYPTSLWGFWGAIGLNNNTQFRQQFQTNLNSNGLAGSNGYPQNLRKIALLNGAVNGTKTNSEGQMFLELAYFKIIKIGQIFGTPIQTKIKGATIEDRFMGSPNVTSQTFAGRATYFTGWNNNFPVVVEGTISRTNSSIRGSMDNTQGGTFNTQGIIKDEFNKTLEDLPGRKSIEWRQYLPNHAFIPSVSALAFKNPNFDWASAINRNLVCDPLNKEINFDSYFAPNINQEHVFVSAENANWLIKELQGIPQPPVFPIDVSALSGNNIICKDDLATYSFANLCKIPSSVTSWNVTSNANIISSNNNSIVIKGNTDGPVTLSANFTNGQTFTKDIRVLTKPFFSVRQYTHVGTEGYYLQLIAPVGRPFSEQLISNITWENLNTGGTGSLQYTPGNSYTNFLLCAPANEYDNYPAYTFCKRDIKVTLSNHCGSTEYIASVGYGQNPLARTANNTLSNSFYKIYPNPTNNIVNVELKSQDIKPLQNSNIIAELYNMMGEVKRNVSITNNIATIDISGLTRGIYLLKINIDGVIESHQVGVE